jgi:hypothetical protein
MPILIVEQPQMRTGGRIMGRVLIGRLPTNGIVISESDVSRLHAWIDRDASDHFFVGDGGSLAGTIVNGRSIEKRRPLNDGDVIRIGTAQIVFSTDEHWPDGLLETDLAGLPPSANTEESGLLFDCHCGAPVWFKAAARGQVHICRHCGRSLIIPDRSSVIAQTIDAPPITEPGFPPTVSPESDPLADAPVDLSIESTDFSGVDLIDEIPGGTSPIHFEEEHGLAEETFRTPYESEAGLTDSIHDVPAIIEPHPHEASPMEIEDFHDPLLSDEAPIEINAVEIDPALIPDEIETPEPSIHSSLESPESVTSSPATTEPMWEEATPATSEAAPDEASPDEEVIPIDLLTQAACHELCSICQNEILPADAVANCPSCGLTFHANCWQENLGCSAYGCPQVNALKPSNLQSTEPESAESGSPVPESADPALAASATDALPTAKDEPDLEPDVFPWEFAFVAVSVAGSLLGALTYGVPSFIGLLGTTIYLASFQESKKRRAVAITALLVCFLGTAAGVYVSYLWWRGWPPIGPLAHRGATP